MRIPVTDDATCDCDWLCSTPSLYHVEDLSRTALYAYWEDWGCLRRFKLANLCQQQKVSFVEVLQDVLPYVVY